MKVIKFCGDIFESKEFFVNSLWVAKQGEDKKIIVVDVPRRICDVLSSMKNDVLSKNHDWKAKFDAFRKEVLSSKSDYLTQEEIDKVSEFLKKLENIYVGLELTSCDFACSLDKILAQASFIYTKIYALILEKEGFRVKACLDENSLLLQMGDKLVGNSEFEGNEDILLYPSGVVINEAGELNFVTGKADFLTCYLAKLSSSQEIEFWLTGHGVPVCNLSLVHGSKHINSMSYQEAMELSHFGSHFVDYRAIEIAKKQNAEIVIKSLSDLDFVGTKIFRGVCQNQDLITGISYIGNIALFRVFGTGMIGRVGTAQRLFGSLAKANISLILISQASSEQSICFAIKSDEENILAATKAIRKEFYYEFEQGIIENLEYHTDLASVSIVGHNMVNRVGLSGKMFSALGKNGVNVRAIAQGSSELNVSVVIANEDVTKAVTSLYSEFFDRKNINLFLVGTGLIGSTLLEQIEKQRDFLKTNYGITMTLKGIADIDKMTFDENLKFEDWRETLQKGQKSDLEQFVEIIKKMNCANSIFIDCTATARMTPLYKELLQESISVVTPNKKANSDEYSVYQDIHTTAFEHNAKFYYETNVGAGLPIISTLKDLLRSGDEIEEIKAVLSGTLSYIFNSFNSQTKFVDVVKMAKELGYTEPNPKEDLTGCDVARKALILSRELGKKINLQDIISMPILPEECLSKNEPEAFLQSLSDNDKYFAEMVKKVEEKGNRLRFLASITKDEAKIGLEEVDSSSPFYSLSDSDNMVVFITKRYTRQMPLIVRGPGAGAAVTAAGVFADIIKIANYLIY